MTSQPKPVAWLLLHGVPLTPACWGPVVQELARTDPADVVAPPLTADQNSSAVQADVAQKLIDEYRDEHSAFHVVGHSFGGQVALEFALRAPDLTADLTLLCTRDTPFPAFTALSAAVRTGPVDVAASLARWFTPAEIDGDGPAVRYTRQTLSDADRNSWATALAAIGSFDCSGRSPSITAPTTIMAAENDGVSTVEAMSAMATRIPGSLLQVLPGAGHMSPFTGPVALARLLRAAADRAATT